MAVTNLTRNLRDGELVITDGTTPTPQSLTVVLDEGDLTWTEVVQTIEVKDRGSIADGHTRPGEEESVRLSFTSRWTQLLGRFATSGDPLQLYEFINFLSGLSVVSTSQAGEQQTLQYEFTVTDPAGAASEKITFAKVYKQSLVLAEGDDANTIAFTGRDFEQRPTVSRV